MNRFKKKKCNCYYINMRVFYVRVYYLNLDFRLLLSIDIHIDVNKLLSIKIYYYIIICANKIIYLINII